jgi:hypothetical protein
VNKKLIIENLLVFLPAGWIFEEVPMGKLNATISWSEEVHHELQLDCLCWPIERDRIVFLQQQPERRNEEQLLI